MKRIFYYSAMIAAALTMVWGCGSSKDDPDELETASSWVKTMGNADKWVVDWSGNDAKPTWTAPDPRSFESWMILMVNLQEALSLYSSSDDLMAVTINDEVRAVASPAISLANSREVSFILKILGNEQADQRVEMTLNYYCSKLHRVFILKGTQYFVPEFVYGVDQTYMPNLLSGCSSYPVNMHVSFHLPQTAQEQLQPQLGDLLAVFVGDECRGVATIDEHLFVIPIGMTVYGRQEGEIGTLYYYNAQENTVWNTKQSVTITASEQSFEVAF